MDQRIPSALACRFVVREGLLALLLGPVALVGLGVFGPPYWLTGRMNRGPPDLQHRATWQVMGSVCAYGMWIGPLSGAAAVWDNASSARRP